MLDDVIDRLLEVRAGRPGKQVQLTEQEIRQLCLTAKEIFMSQPNLLELEAPIKICGIFWVDVSVSAFANDAIYINYCEHRLLTGDIHGQYSDLLRLFEYGGFPPEANYLFLGDYVDRGKQSLETICLLLAYKVASFKGLQSKFSTWAYFQNIKYVHDALLTLEALAANSAFVICR